MVYNLLYHSLCLIFLILIYTDFRGKRTRLPGSVVTVYLMTALIILTDCGWNVMEWTGYKPVLLCYAVNILYFIAGAADVYAWARYSVTTLSIRSQSNRRLLLLFSLPAAVFFLLTLTTPFTGFIFSIDNGVYIRGSLFAVDVVVKLSYLIFAIAYTFVSAWREPRKYLKKRTLLLGIFCLPVLIGGILQALLGLDFNCIAPVLSLSIVYKFGLSNESRDMENLLNAIGQAYAATFIIDTDSHTVSALAADEQYAPIAAVAHNSSYEECLVTSIRHHVLPEDKMTVERAFSIRNLLSQLEKKGVYSVIYKISTPDGQGQYNKATFLKAFSDEGRREIVLGIEKLETRQLLLQQKEELENERDEAERVKESLTNVLANIIEARDLDSGEHVLRVKNFTQILCDRMMEDYPEYGLTPLKIRYIVQGSALHDVGKIMIPDAILLKPDRLSPEEMEIMKTHCVHGCELLNKFPCDLDEEYISYAREICRWHHEKYDGKGYPDGLVGDSIPVSAQIVSLADCYDALTSPRVYKKAFTPDEAFRMIMNGECGAFSRKLLKCFEKVYGQMKAVDEGIRPARAVGE